MTVTKLILLYALTLMDEDWLELLPIYFLPSTMVIYWAWQGYIGEYTPEGLCNISRGAKRRGIYCSTPREYILQCTLHFRVSKSQISYLPFIGLKHVFLCKKIKSLMYFDILIKIMLYKSIFSCPVSSKSQVRGWFYS